MLNVAIRRLQMGCKESKNKCVRIPLNVFLCNGVTDIHKEMSRFVNNFDFLLQRTLLASDLCSFMMTEKL